MGLAFLITRPLLVRFPPFPSVRRVRGQAEERQERMSISLPYDDIAYAKKRTPHLVTRNPKLEEVRDPILGP